jgi:hypothetical protein
MDSSSEDDEHTIVPTNSQADKIDEDLHFKKKCNYHLVSRKCELVTDKGILEGKSLSTVLSPKNYQEESIEGISTLYLFGWRHFTGKRLETALLQQKFPYVEEIHYAPNAASENYDAPDYAEEKVIALASVLPKFPNLKILDIETYIGEKGGEALGAALPLLPNLLSLSTHGFMGSTGVMRLAKGLNHPKLTTLSLKDTGTRDVGYYAAVERLPFLPNLLTFCFDGKTPHIKTKQDFDQAIKDWIAEIDPSKPVTYEKAYKNS